MAQTVPAQLTADSLQIVPMDALLASYFLQSALACVFLVALWGIVFIYRRPLHMALAMGWSIYLLHMLASLAAAAYGRTVPMASRQWSTATIQLLAVLGSCTWLYTAMRILAAREARAVLYRPAVLGAVAAAGILIGCSLSTGRILHQPGSGPLGDLYPILYAALSVEAWRAARSAPRHGTLLRWMAVSFALFVLRLVLVTRVLLPEPEFARAALSQLLAVATTQIVQMVAVGVITLGIAVSYERAAVLEQIERSRANDVRLRKSERLEMLGRMAAGIAHDFNNILAAISANVEFARISLWQPRDVEAELDALDATVTRAGELTGRLMAFANPSALSTGEQVITVDRVVEANRAMLTRLAGMELTLDITLHAPEAQVALDRTQFEQVLLNLVVNGRDATPQHGTVSVRTSVEEVIADRPVHDGVLSPGRYVRVSVADTGSGIPPEVLPHVLEPFFTTKGHEGGTGIGLATVHQIVVAADGDLAITSTPGVGTQFDVFLPLRA